MALQFELPVEESETAQPVCPKCKGTRIGAVRGKPSHLRCKSCRCVGLWGQFAREAEIIRKEEKSRPWLTSVQARG